MHAYPTAGRANLVLGTNGVPVYAAIGIALSCAGAIFACTRRRAPASVYASEMYQLSSRSHRIFALASVAFALAFAPALKWTVLAVPLLAVYTLVLIFYLSSFARGFSGEDE